MKLFNNKRCPRCNTKVPVGTGVCPDCRLNFQKFESATNEEAKNAIRQGEKERVLMRKGCPSDVKKFKLLLMALFLGFTGAHYYYVGRYKMGIFCTTFFIIGIVNAVVRTFVNISPSGDLWQIFTLLVLGWGAVLVIWIIDLAKICLNKFKIPVSRE